MNHFDDERNIITMLQFTRMNKILFVNMTWKSVKFFCSLYEEKKFQNWKNSSGKNDVPPDFFSEKYKYMLEVMRVDDFALGNNSPNVLESKIVKQVDDLLREKGLPPTRESNIQMLIIPDYSKASENSYVTYVENFKRVVCKHLEKIESYRNNHPQYKLGFLIFDESFAYFQADDKTTKLKPGKPVKGFPHDCFKDKELVEVLLYSDLDFVIWMTPNKNQPMNPNLYPNVCVFDLKKCQKRKMRMRKYDGEKVICMEVKNWES